MTQADKSYRKTRYYA